jgi:hypothetical protein
MEVINTKTSEEVDKKYKTTATAFRIAIKTTWCSFWQTIHINSERK